MDTQNTNQTFFKTKLGKLILVIFWPLTLTYLFYKSKSPSKYKFPLIAIVWTIILIISFTSTNNPSTPGVETSTKTEQKKEVVKRDVNEVANLTHQQLYNLVKNDSSSVIGKKYRMTLYLEQAPTETDADFMSQPDDNSNETILITCKMSKDDLLKLDGLSAQNRNYLPYDVELSFESKSKFVDLAYMATCSLR